MAKAKAKPPALSAKASALLDAQVKYFLERLDGKLFATLLEAEIDALLEVAKQLKLEEVVARQTVKDTVRTYAVELELGGAIPELVAEVARALSAHKVQAKTKLIDVLPDKHFKEILDKVLELHDVREQLLHQALSNPVITSMSSDLLYRGIQGYLGESAMARIPGAQSMMKLGKSMLSRATPKLDRALEDALKNYIHQNIQNTLRDSEASLKKLLTDDSLRDAALDIWDSVKRKTLAELRRPVADEDIEDFFVIGYEYWRSARKTSYYSEVINVGIDCFFDKYGKTSLHHLLGEIGLGRAHLLADGLRFAPQVLKVLQKKKLIEPILRRHLGAFFASETVVHLLAD